MSLEHDPKPTWSDPAPTTVTPAAIDPAAPATPGVPPVAPVAPAPAAVTPVGPVAVSQPKKSGAWVNLLLGAAAIIAVGGVAFAVGRSTAPAAAASIGGFQRGNGVILTPGGSFDPNDPPAGGFGGGRGFFGAGGPTLDGKVASVSADSMTVTLASGDTVTVKLDGTTTYHQSTTATASDVAVGDQVAVRVNGGRLRTQINGGGPNASAAPNTTTDSLTATDVTVSR